MDLGTRVTLVAAALAVAGLVWAAMRARRGRLAAGGRAGTLPADLAARAGSRLTVLQISSEHCVACEHAARVWSAAADADDGVRHVVVDAGERLGLVREQGVLTTPTTLLYDGDGILRGRVTGAPTPRQAAAALALDPIGARA